MYSKPRTLYSLPPSNLFKLMAPQQQEQSSFLNLQENKLIFGGYLLFDNLTILSFMSSPKLLTVASAFKTNHEFTRLFQPTKHLANSDNVLMNPQDSERALWSCHKSNVQSRHKVLELLSRSGSFSGGHGWVMFVHVQSLIFL